MPFTYRNAIAFNRAEVKAKLQMNNTFAFRSQHMAKIVTDEYCGVGKY